MDDKDLAQCQASSIGGDISGRSSTHRKRKIHAVARWSILFVILVVSMTDCVECSAELDRNQVS